MVWLGEHRAFVLEEYIRSGGSQRAFRIRFELDQYDSIFDRKTIQD